MIDDEDRITLTQRRNSSGAEKLKKSKLETIETFDEEDEGGSPKRIIIWIIIIIALAAAGYFGLKTYLEREIVETPPVEEEVEEEVDPAEDIIGKNILPDSFATNLPTAENFSLEDQKIGEESADGEFELSKLFVQPYESFSRIEFVIANLEDIETTNTEPTEAASSEDDEQLPFVTAKYEAGANMIKLQVNRVQLVDIALDSNELISVDESNIISIVREAFATDGQENFTIRVKPNSKFYLQLFEDGFQTKLALDIQENRTDDESNAEITTTPSVSVTTSIAPSPVVTSVVPSTIAPTSSGGVNLSNEFSTGEQSIKTNTTGNTVGISKYNFFDGTSVFTYRLFLTGSGTQPYPNVSAKLDGSKLTLQISNLSIDGVVGNGGSGSTDFAARGVRTVKSVNIKNSNNVSTYVFDLTKSTQYRIFIEEDNKILRLEIKH
jgi:hypothetical protein